MEHSSSLPYSFAVSYGVPTLNKPTIYRSVPKHNPLTKQVDQLAYFIPNNKYAKNPWNYAPEFLKVFGDVCTHIGSQAVFDCILLGSPRPKVCWLFNGGNLTFGDVQIDDTANLCRLTIPHVRHYHFGTYTVLCENEVGRVVASANLMCNDDFM